MSTGEEEEILEGQNALEEALNKLEDGPNSLNFLLKGLSADVREEIMSADFEEMRRAEFDQLDEDASGTLEMEELFPLIEAIAEVHPWSVSWEHCQRFLELFDENGDGVLQFSEYLQMVRYVIAFAFSEYETENRDKERSALEELEAMKKENERLKNVLDSTNQKYCELQKNFNKIVRGAAKDSNAQLQKEQKWRSRLQGKFKDLLSDYRTVMTVAKQQKKQLGANAKTVGAALPPVTKSTSTVRLGRRLQN